MKDTTRFSEWFSKHNVDISLDYWLNSFVCVQSLCNVLYESVLALLFDTVVHQSDLAYCGNLTISLYCFVLVVFSELTCMMCCDCVVELTTLCVS